MNRQPESSIATLFLASAILIVGFLSLIVAVDILLVPNTSSAAHLDTDKGL